MILPNFQMFGERVLLRDLPQDTEVEGIVIPESGTRTMLMLEVVAVGDGRTPNGVKKMHVKVGDRVVAQSNPSMLHNNMQKVNDQKYISLLQHDLIAKVDAGMFNLTLDGFQPIGRWVLVRVDAPEKVGAIFIPGQSQPLRSPGEVKTYLTKQGDEAAEILGIETGTRVLLEHVRVNPISIQRKPYAYVDYSSVASAISGEIDPVLKGA